jgi:hypothetical protein
MGKFKCAQPDSMSLVQCGALFALPCRSWVGTRFWNDGAETLNVMRTRSRQSQRIALMWLTTRFTTGSVISAK